MGNQGSCERISRDYQGYGTSGVGHTQTREEEWQGYQRWQRQLKRMGDEIALPEEVREERRREIARQNREWHREQSRQQKARADAMVEQFARDEEDRQRRAKELPDVNAMSSWEFSAQYGGETGCTLCHGRGWYPMPVAKDDWMHSSRISEHQTSCTVRCNHCESYNRRTEGNRLRGIKGCLLGT